MENSFVQRGGLWVLGQGMLLLAVLLCALVWRGQWQSLPLFLLGVFLLLTFALCGSAGARSLGRNLTPFPRPRPTTELVETGIYRLMRHPLYFAVICGALGWSLVWRSWPALGVALVLGPFFDLKARQEERWLRKRFPQYADYSKRVKRLVPWIY